MATPVNILGSGNDRGVKSSNAQALFTGTIPVPAKEIPDSLLIANRAMRNLFANSAGSNAMNVNGSVTPQTFFIASVAERVQFIASIRFLFRSTNVNVTANLGEFDRFGAATANATPLTNGVKLETVQGGVITDIFTPTVKTMGQFFNSTDLFVSFTACNFLSFTLNFDRPVILPEGTLDLIRVIVQDNLTALSSFNVAADGWYEAA